MRHSHVLLFGFLLLAAVYTTCSSAQNVKRSLQDDEAQVFWDDEWERSDPAESVSDGSPWSSNSIGSTSRNWDTRETIQKWSHSAPSSRNIDYDYSDEWPLWSHPAQKIGVPVGGNSTERHLEAILRGVPGVDFPNYNTIPDTQFDCSEQATRGYYGDVEAECQVFHICQAEGRKDSFLCPLGTIFNQKYFVCDWWFNFNCSDSPQYYELNEHVYKDEKDEGMKMQPWNPPGMAKGVPSRRSGDPAVFRGKSIDEWSSGRQTINFGDKMHSQMPTWDQNGRGKGHVGKVNGNVIWNRSTGKKGVQDTRPRPPTFPMAGRTTTKSSGLSTKKNGNVPINGSIRAWTGSSGRSGSPSVINEINKTPNTISRSAGFGMRTKSSSSIKTATYGSWKPSSNTIAKITPTNKRKALLEIANNAVWPGNENTRRKNVPRFSASNPATSNPIIRPTGTRGVWEQESSGKRRGSNHMWKLSAAYRKGTVRKPSASSLKSTATEINNSVTSSSFSSFGKRKGVTSGNWKTTQKPENLKFQTLPGLNSEDSYVLLTTSSINLTRTLESTLRDSVQEHSFGGTTSQIPHIEAENNSRYEHVPTLTGTTVPVQHVAEHGVGKITAVVRSSTTGYGVRNPQTEWNTNDIPQTKARN